MCNKQKTVEQEDDMTAILECITKQLDVLVTY